MSMQDNFEFGPLSEAFDGLRDIRKANYDAALFQTNLLTRLAQNLVEWLKHEPRDPVTKDAIMNVEIVSLDKRGASLSLSFGDSKATLRYSLTLEIHYEFGARLVHSILQRGERASEQFKRVIFSGDAIPLRLAGDDQSDEVGVELRYTDGNVKLKPAIDLIANFIRAIHGDLFFELAPLE